MSFCMNSKVPSTLQLSLSILFTGVNKNNLKFPCGGEKTPVYLAYRWGLI